MVEQIPPMNELDTVYIVPAYYLSSTRASCISQVNATINVTIETSQSTNFTTHSISAGTQFDVDSPKYDIVLESSAPLLVTSYSENPNYWTVFPGVNQYLPKYKILIPSGWTTNYVIIVIRVRSLDSLRANGQLIDRVIYNLDRHTVSVGGLIYTVQYYRATEGELTLKTVDGTPFGLMVYGHREDVRYSFVGSVVHR
jgi:hypothetical protein